MSDVSQYYDKDLYYVKPNKCVVTIESTLLEVKF